MKHIQVNEKCDQDCAVKCLSPMAGCETLYFEPSCLASCRCKFDVEELDPEEIKLRMDNITRNLENVNRFFKDLNKENMKVIKPTFDKYLKKAEGLHNEFADLLKEHASKVLGCEEECLEDCLDPKFVSFWEIPMCVRHCKCESGLISIEREEEVPSFIRKRGNFMTIFGEEEEEKELEKELEEEEEVLNKEEGIFSNIISRGKSLFTKTDVIEDELLKEKLLKKKPYYRREGDILREKGHLKGHFHENPLLTHKKHEEKLRDFNLPELMKYSDYDRKAWAFFKRYQDEI